MSKRFLFGVSAAVLSACLAVAPASGKAVPDTVAGVVFMDTNRNGRLDTGEKPLRGARVTDGVSIVTPAADGAIVPIIIDPRPTKTSS